MMRCLLVSFAILGVWCLGLASGQYCTPFTNPSSAPEQPELPPVYEARIEVNHLSGEKRSTNVVHNFDYNRRRASILTQSNNTNTHLVFDYETNEIHVVTSPADFIPSPPNAEFPTYREQKCTTYSMTNTPDLNWHFGYQQLNETYLLPGTVYEAIRFRNFPVAYNGTETVRGIPCDVWLSCQYIPQLKANFTARHYFSKPSHGMPHQDSNFTRIPVRTEFIGVRIKPDGSSENFVEVNDFVDFIVGFASHDSMHTPTGVFCENRKVSRPIPHIEDGYKRFLMSEEIVNEGERAGGTAVTYIKNYYFDEGANCVRFDYRNLKKEADTFYTLDPITVIHDYNVGVAIGINHLQGNCSFIGISNTTFEEDSNYTNTEVNTENAFIVRLKSGKSLLLLDGDYAYTGRRYVDDIPVSTFLSKRNLFNQSILMEYAFTANGFEIGEGNEITRDIPTHFQLYREDHKNTYSTFYEFETRRRLLESFDVSRCYDSSQKIGFKLDFDFKDKLPVGALVNHEWMVETAYDTLILATNESLTRFSYPRITITDDGKLHIVSSLLPAPPAITLFTKIPGKWLTGTGIAGSQFGVKSADVCAEFCLSKTNCLSFDWNFASGSCYANTKHGSEANLGNYSNYSHWSRNTIGSYGSKQSFKLWEALQKDVEAKNVTLMLPIINPNGSHEFIALQAYAVGTYQPEIVNLEAVIALSKYSVKYQQRKYADPKDKTVMNLKIEECASLCTGEAGFECRSFHFCFASGECRLNSQFTSSSDAYTKDECNIYEQDPLIHYTEFPLRASINSKDKKYKNVKSAKECAIKCNGEDKIHCRSFNFCPGQDLCYLSETHLLDSSDAGTGDLVCTHYSRNYLSDFTFVSTEYINLDAELVYTGTTLEECSRVCVGADGFDCKSFDFCPTSKTCMLNSGFKPISSFENGTQGIAMDECSNYKREFFFVTSSIANAKAQSDNSEAVLAGVTVPFTLLALVAGIIGMHIFIKKKLTVA